MRLGLRERSAMVAAVVFIMMVCMTFLFIRHYSTQIARDLGSEYAQENAMRYAEKIKGTVDFDLTMTLKFAVNPLIGKWAEDEGDASLKAGVFTILNEYVQMSRAGSWFIAFEQSGHYYFNDSNGTYTGEELIKTLSRKNQNDRWFFHTLDAAEAYNLNIDYDEALGLTKLWLNVPILKNGKRIGVMGVGFDYTEFIDDYIAEDKEGFTTMILNAEGAIIAHKEKRYVNYHLDMMDSAHWTTLSSIVDRGHNENMIPDYLHRLIEQNNTAVSFDLYLHGHHYIASATYMPHLKWINLSMVDLDNVFGFKEMISIVVIYLILSVVSWLILYWILKRYLIAPIGVMSEATNRIREGNYNIYPLCQTDRKDEIGQLCRNIGEMAIKINESAKNAEEKYRWLADNTSDVIWVMELDGSFDYISPSVEKMRGYTAEEVMRQKIDEVICPDSLKEVQKGIADALAEVVTGNAPSTRTLMIEQPHKNGATIWTEATAKLILDEDGKPFRFIGSTRDVSDRINRDEEIRKLAFYDSLTSLANRRLLLDRLEQAILVSKRHHSLLGLIYLDLDNFKPLNDHYGHEAGDELLIEVGRRIKECVRQTDTVARFGGDEFVVLIGNLGSEREKAIEYTMMVADKIKETLSAPYELQKTRYELTASIGANVFGDEVGSTHEAIGVVDTLMYQAKRSVS